MVEQTDKTPIPGDEQRVNVQGYSDPWDKEVSFWQEVLANPELGYTGDIMRGAELLTHFSQGMDYVVKKHGMTVKPELALMPTPGLPTPNTFVDKKNHLVIIRASFLSDLSAFDPKSMYHFSGEDGGGIVFSGYVDHFAFIEGVEEARHEFAKQRGWIDMQNILSPSIDFVAYDSQQHELDALMEMTLAAVDRDFPPISIKSLQNRIEAATSLGREG